jgi:hypothetical protein
VFGDVGGDGGEEEVVSGIVRRGCLGDHQALAERGGGDVFVDGVEQVDAGELGGGEREAVGWAERRAGAADDDPIGELEQAAGGPYFL